MVVELYEETKEEIDARNISIHILYDMHFHEERVFKGWNVTRVPGGWIYRTNRQASEVFVPFNNEFQKCKDNQ